MMAAAAVLVLFSAAMPTAEAQSSSQALFAVNVPFESIGSATNTGAITLLSITSSGSASGSLGIHQGTSGVPGANETGDYFGGATAWGDVDGNGIDDLIVGVPYEDIGSKTDAGAITVLYDAGSGSFTSATSLHQGSSGVPGANEAGDVWGFSVASGDLDGDGYDDVMVGAPGEDIGNDDNTGAVTVLFGGSGGLTGSGSKAYHQDSSGVPGVNEDNDAFGHSVTITGGVSGSSMFAAAGSPGEKISGVDQAGSVTLFSTGSGGLVPKSPSLYAGASASNVRPAMPGGLFLEDRFGYRLSSGDDFIVIGVPFADLSSGGTQVDAGYIMVYEGLYGNPTVGQLAQVGAIESGNFYGWSTSAQGNVNNFSIVVGAPGTTVGGEPNAGAMYVVLNAGITEWHQDSPGVPGIAEAGDEFGNHVEILPNGAIFVGAPGEDIGSNTDTGAGTVMFGPLGSAGSIAIRSIHQDKSGVPGKNETNDAWGI